MINLVNNQGNVKVTRYPSPITWARLTLPPALGVEKPQRSYSASENVSDDRCFRGKKKY